MRLNGNVVSDITGLTGLELTVPTPEIVVTQRAREIALIDERNPDQFAQDDWD